MKNIVLVLFAIAMAACSKTPENEPIEKQFWIFIDRTDDLTTTPDTLALFTKLRIDQDMYDGYKVSITSISDLDINKIETVSLQSASHWDTNPEMREAEIARFKRELREKYLSVVGRAKGTCNHSIIYRQLCRGLNDLAQSKAQFRSVIVASDLMENDSISFYKKQTMNDLQRHPLVIEHLLQMRGGMLGDLRGIHAYFIYSPPTYELNNRYMIVSTFFARMLQRRHAIVHIGDNI